MELFGKSILKRYQKKNRGNKPLETGIKELNRVWQEAKWENYAEAKKQRKDCDRVHMEGFFFFDPTKSHRILVGMFFDVQEINVLWIGDHDEYDSIFNNKGAIAKWLKKKGHVE